jgi:hypothetical protein
MIAHLSIEVIGSWTVKVLGNGANFHTLGPVKNTGSIKPARSVLWN